MLKVLNRILDRVITLFLVVLFLIAAYALWDTAMVFGKGDDPMLEYKPGYDTKQAVDRNIPGMACWIEIPDTSIDYPVMQGEDNTEYLDKDPLGNDYLGGSIFLDYRNDPGFTDDYSLLYGHHMQYKAMFGALDDYLDLDYLKNHQDGRLLFPDGSIKEFRLFGAIETTSDINTMFCPANYDTGAVLDYLRGHTDVIDKKEFPNDDVYLIGLSTCKHPDTLDRIIVFGYFKNLRKETETNVKNDKKPVPDAPKTGEWFWK